MKRNAWWALGDGTKGEPVPCYKGEVAVVKIEWSQTGWTLTLSDKTKHERKILSCVGWDPALKDVAVFLLPDGQGNEKQFRNAIPKALRDAAYEAQHKHLKKEAKKARENFSPSIPITKEQGIDTRHDVGYSTKGQTVPFQGKKEKQAMAKTLKVSRAKVVELFQALDYKTADKWNDKRLVEKMQGLPAMVDDDTDAEDEELNKLLKDLLKAMEKGTGIELTQDDDGAEEEAEEEEAPAPKKGKKPAKAAKEEEEEDEEEESEDEDEDSDDEEGDDEEADEDDGDDEEAEEEEEEEEAPAKKPAKKQAPPAKAEKPAKKAAKGDDEEEDETVPVTKPKKKAPPAKKGPGVIQTIIACLRAASEKKPTTKEAILAKLVETFPEREEKAMKSTISSQIPSGLKVEKGLIVQSNDKGVWLPKE